MNENGITLRRAGDKNCGGSSMTQPSRQDDPPNSSTKDATTDVRPPVRRYELTRHATQDVEDPAEVFAASTRPTFVP